MLDFTTLTSVRSSTLFALALAVLGMLGWDLALRQSLGDVVAGWDYWNQSAAGKYLAYGELERERRLPDVLLVGDSSGDFGFSPVDFDSVAGVTSFNLATMGNFPLSFDMTVNDLVIDHEGEAPAYLFIVFTRGTFEKRDELRDTERAIVNAPVVRRAQGEFVLGDVLFSARLWPARVQLLDWLRGRRHDGQPGRTVRTMPAVQVQAPDEQRPFVVDAERLGVLARTFELCRERGITPILVHPPIHSLERERWENPDAYVEAVDSLTQEHGVAFWDYSGDTSYDPLMSDLVHVSPSGAARFSRAVGQRFRMELP